MKKRIKCPNNHEHPISDWYGKYDSFACLVCDIWTEPVCNCDESECEFRANNRPDRPSDLSK